MSSQPRPEIPLPMQRLVRQRCGFGCVICGMPLYEYEHMEGWANVKEHVAEDITLLCDQHHREKTGGLLPLEHVRAADAAPYNLRAGVSKPYDLHYSGSTCEAVIGSNTFTTADRGFGTVMIPVSVDDVVLLGFILADGHLLLNLVLFDELNELILHIRNNELVYRPDSWDIELVGRRLIVREAARKILIDISFEVPNRIVIDRGRFLCNGVEILIRPDHLLVTNNAMLMSGNRAIDCPGGLIVGRQSRPIGAMIRMPSVQRYFGDRSAAVKWARESLDRAV